MYYVPILLLFAQCEDLGRVGLSIPYRRPSHDFDRLKKTEIVMS